MDLLAGTPKTALWVTSLRIRRWPERCVLGDDGGVMEPIFGADACTGADAGAGGAAAAAAGTAVADWVS